MLGTDTSDTAQASRPRQGVEDRVRHLLGTDTSDTVFRENQAN
jgi:hypothetical protein